MSQGRILAVDDDPQIQRMLCSQLGARGYQVRAVNNGPDALLAVADEEPDLVLLDITMQGMDGLEVCRQLREWSTLPIILLTAADSPQTKITALDLGADDYLTKPFHMGELLARIRAVLRRSADGEKSSGVIETGDLIVDLAQRVVHRGEEEISLTRTEFELLRELVTHPDRVLTYSHLLNAVWGPGYDDVHMVQVHISNLRRKIERGSPGQRCIRADAGVGYRFSAPQ
jgi:two-component system, OmpR family, KDP operon response regulator KdpE